MSICSADGKLAEMFERFTPRARQVMVLAVDEARLLDHGFVGTEHILLGLIHDGEGVAAQVLAWFGVSLDATREKVRDIIGDQSHWHEEPPFTPRAMKALELSAREAKQLGHDFIGTEHLLLGLIREGEGVAAQVLIGVGADLLRVRQQVINAIGGNESSGPPSK